MTNAVPQGSIGAPTSTNSALPYSPMPPRRTSYASVAAGTAAASPPNQAPPAHSGTFSYVLTPNSVRYGPSHLTDAELRSQTVTQSSEPTILANDRSNIPSPWGKVGEMVNQSNQYSFGGVYSVQNNIGPAFGGFFAPSYLRKSRYMERLEAAHKAKVATQKEVSFTHTSANHVPISANSSTVSLHKMTPSHRGMTYDIVEHHSPVEEDAVPPLPCKWAEVDKYGGLEICGEGFDVRYTIPSTKAHEFEAAAARADHPMPSQCGIYYFEVTIIHKGKEGIIGIGFSGPRVSLEKLPGWETDSWAYHGDDGMSFCSQSTGRTYGPTFTTNDTIGCGVNFMTGCAFFTKNGVFQGNAFKDLKDIKLYPSVGAKKPGAHLRCNFGQTAFVFDIDGMMSQEKSNIMAEINLSSIERLQPPLSEDALIKELVSQFLRHDGYVDTAKAFTEEMNAEKKALKSGANTIVEGYGVHEDLDAINRQQIRASILEGDIDKALKRTRACYPDVLVQNPRIHFRLRCRKFVEMIRQSTEIRNGFPNRPAKQVNGHGEEIFGQAMDLDDPMSNGDDWDRMETEEGDNGMRYQEKLSETLRYAQELKFEFKDDPSKEVKDTLASIFALFAYEDPRTSPTAPVMDQSGRVPVAEELNSAILVSLGKSSAAALERLCQQTEVLLNDISEHGGAGAFINMDHDFLR